MALRIGSKVFSIPVSSWHVRSRHLRSRSQGSRECPGCVDRLILFALETSTEENLGGQTGGHEIPNFLGCCYSGVGICGHISGLFPENISIG